MARRNQRDWLMAGLDILAEHGAAALTIEQLSGALAVTKGSFYHHFRGIGDYKTALLAFAEAAGTLAVIAETQQQATPAERLRFLLGLVAAAPPRLEIAVRAWAHDDPEARTMQARIDQQRLDYLAALCRQLAPDELRGQLMAQIAYLIYLGARAIQPPLTASALHALFDEFCQRFDIP